MKSVSSKDKAAYWNRIMKHILNSSSELNVSCVDISIKGLVPVHSVTDDHQYCQKARDLDRLMLAIMVLQNLNNWNFFHCLHLAGQ